MNKLTKLLSVFVIAGAVGTGATFASGCAHKHSYSDEWKNDDPAGHYHMAICEHTEEHTEPEAHKDEKINATDAAGNDYLCDVCGYDMATHVTGVTLNTPTKSLEVGDSFKLTASVLPSDASIKDYTFSSSKTDVATVAQDGTVTAKAKGEATITVTTADGAKTATCKITVTEKDTTPQTVAVTSITLDTTTLELEKDDTHTFTVTVKPDNATNAEVTITSSNEEIVSVKGKTITAEAEGTATITVTAKDGSGVKATCEVKVKPRTSAKVSVTGVEIDKETASVEEGKTVKITASILPSTATNKNVTWASSDTTIATVDEDGTVKGVKAGKANITVTTADGNFTKTCEVTVTPATVAVTGVEISQETASVEEGKTVTITASVLPADATNKNVTWESSDTAVATVDEDGVVTGVKAGTANITVKTADGNFSKTCAVTVTDKPTTDPDPVETATIGLGTNSLQFKKGETAEVELKLDASYVGKKVYMYSYDSSSDDPVELTVTGSTEAGSGVVVTYAAGLKVSVKYTGEEDGEVAVFVYPVIDMGENEVTAAVGANPFAVIADEIAEVTATVQGETDGNVGFRGMSGQLETEKTFTVENGIAVINLVNNGEASVNVTLNIAEAQEEGPEFNGTEIALDEVVDFTAGYDYLLYKVELAAGSYTLNFTGCNEEDLLIVVGLSFNANGEVVDEIYPENGVYILTENTTVYIALASNLMDEEWNCIDVTAKLTVTEAEDEGEEKSIYEQLMERTSEHLVTIPAAGTTIETLNGYYKNGIYVKDGSATVATEGTDTVLKQVKVTANVHTYLVLGPVKGVVEGYFETKISDKANGQQNLIDFCDASGSQLKIDSDGAKIRYTVKGGAATATDKAFAKDTYYAIYFKFDLETGKVTLKIDDTTVLDDEATVINSLSYVQLLSSNSGGRLHTTKNLVICGTKLTADEYRSTAQAAIDKAHYEMVGKDAVGTEGEEGYQPAITASHGKNKSVIDEAYAAIDLDSSTTIDALVEEINKFVGLKTTIDSDSKINAAITEATTALNEFKTEHADEYTTNATAYSQAIDAAIASLANAKSVSEVTALASTEHLLDDVKSDAKIEEEAFAAAKVTAAGVLKADWDAYLAANADVAASDYKEGVHTAYDTAVAEVAAATTSTEVNTALTKFDSAKKGELKKGDVDEYKMTKSEELDDYADAIIAKLDAENQTPLIVEINKKRNSYKNEIEAFSKANSNTTQEVDAKLSEAKTAIDKLVAIDAITDYANKKLTLVQGSSEAASTADTAINNALNDAIADIEAAENKTAIESAKATGESAIDDAIAELYKAEFTVTINGVEGVTAAKVKYGNKVVLDESGVAVTTWIKGWYTEAEKTNEYDFEAPVYGNVILYANTVQCIGVDINYEFSYAAITGLSTDKTQIDNNTFKDTVNSFLVINGKSNNVVWRAATSGGECIEVKGANVSFTLPEGIAKDGATITVAIASTGSSNVSTFGLKDKSGKYIKAATKDEGLTETTDNTYQVTGTTAKVLTFKVDAAGKYTIDGGSERATRLSQIKVYSERKELVAVTGVTINGEATQAIAEVGGTLDLVANVEPATATYQTVTWESDTPAVATVDASGKVTAVAQGVAVITVTTTDGNKTASVTIDVAGFLQAQSDAKNTLNNIEKPTNETDLATFNAKLAEAISAINGCDNGVDLAQTLADYQSELQSIGNAWTVTYNFYQGTEAKTATQLVVKTEAFSAFKSGLNTKRDGYRFLYWYEGANEATEYTVSSSNVLNSDITLTAKYEQGYMVSFDSDGGSEVASVWVAYTDGTQTVSEPTSPSRSGYSFKGWLLDGATFDFATPVTADITLTAHWQVIQKETQVFANSSIGTSGGYAKDADIVTGGKLFNVKAAMALVKVAANRAYTYADDDSKSVTKTDGVIHTNADVTQDGIDFIKITATKAITMNLYVSGLTTNLGKGTRPCAFYNGTTKLGETSGQDTVSLISFDMAAEETVTLKVKRTGSNETYIGLFSMEAVEK